MNIRRILVVCTGNSCRSVMAQGLMQQAMTRAGLGAIQVESAGVFAMDGMSPTRETQRVLLEAGVDCSNYRARSVTMEMLEAADLILVMEEFQAEEIARRAPSARAKVHLLNTFGMSQPIEGGRAGIPDPIGKPLEVYEVCFAEIRDAVERIVRSLGVASGGT